MFLSNKDEQLLVNEKSNNNYQQVRKVRISGEINSEEQTCTEDDQLVPICETF